ncbi:MAG: hydantoinase/oxoprolinase family protein [Solirubrobacterales bacterium]
MSDRTTLAVDVGGTFTDAALSTPAGVFTGKTPTTPEDQSIGVIAAANGALEAAGIDPVQVDEFIHGMTTATNALLEGRFARTALIATAGFTDIEELGRQNRADLYRLGAARPGPIVPNSLRFGLAERCGPGGVLDPLDPAEARRAVEQAVSAGAESIAVCLLFAFRHPQHELVVREAARAADPDLHVSLSHETVGTFREYERCATTVADAALSPLLSGYLARLIDRSEATGLPKPQVMLSNGGTVPAEIAGANASWTVLSGPAGGAVGAAVSARRVGEARGLAFDMGGTSTDISVSTDGEVALSAAREIGGRPIALPAVDVSTVGAGGGSIAWRDAGGALRVGPRSAGARPGPACYGYGGTEPTVTDANLLLGYLAADSELAGGLRLDVGAAEAALERLGAPLGLTALETAAGILRIANLEMLRATTAATVARGIDPREHALIAFGGAGPMHAAAIAEELQIPRVICPAACGVLSAWGMSVSGSRRDRSISVVRPLADVTAAELAELENELASAAADDLGVTLRTHASTYELRYAGQAFELPVAGEFSDLESLFHAAHESQFGFSDVGAPIELVTVRVSVGGNGTGKSGGGSELSASPPVAATSRAAWFDGEQHESSVVRGALQGRVAGPALIEQPQATIVVPPGWAALARGADVILEHEGAAR